MSGPFTLEPASVIFGAPFHSLPMGLVKKVPGDGQWKMIRHLLKQNDEGQSKNGWVDSDEFPNIYFAASWVCHYLSPPAFALAASRPAADMSRCLGLPQLIYMLIYASAWELKGTFLLEHGSCLCCIKCRS